MKSRGTQFVTLDVGFVRSLRAVVAVRAGGTEIVLEKCLPGNEALEYVATFNAASHWSGVRAEARPIRFPSQRALKA